MAEIVELDEVASSGDGSERGHASGEGLVEGLLDDDDDYDSEEDEDYNPAADLNGEKASYHPFSMMGHSWAKIGLEIIFCRAKTGLCPESYFQSL